MLIIDYLTTIINNFYHISYLLSLDMNQLEIEKQLRLLKNNWKLINNKIQINLKFSNFDNAFNFMKEVAKECDLLNHHPLWTNEYNRLEIILFTHDKGSITELDFKLARIIDQKLIDLK